MLQIFIPAIKKEGEEVSGQSDTDILLYLIVDSPYQQRAKMYHNKLLSLAAQNKAEDMRNLDYFGHTSPSGVTANENIRSVGYVLPDWYSEKGNNCESLYLGWINPEDAVVGWLGSSGHRVHVFGENNFYKDQECIGVGHSVAKDDRHLYIFISAVCMD